MWVMRKHIRALYSSDEWTTMNQRRRRVSSGTSLISTESWVTIDAQQSPLTRLIYDWNIIERIAYLLNQDDWSNFM